MPLLGDAPFPVVVNGDVYCDMDFGRFANFPLASGHAPPGHGRQPAPPHRWAPSMVIGSLSLKGRPNSHLRRDWRFSRPFEPAYRLAQSRNCALLNVAIAAGTLSGERFAWRWVDDGNNDWLNWIPELATTSVVVNLTLDSDYRWPEWRWKPHLPVNSCPTKRAARFHQCRPDRCRPGPFSPESAAIPAARLMLRELARHFPNAQFCL